MVSLPAPVVMVSMVTVSLEEADSVLLSSSSLSELLEEELSDATSGAFLATHTLQTHAAESGREEISDLRDSYYIYHSRGLPTKNPKSWFLSEFILVWSWMGAVHQWQRYYISDSHAGATYGSGLVWCSLIHWSPSPQESCILVLFQSCKYITQLKTTCQCTIDAQLLAFKGNFFSLCCVCGWINNT